MCHGDPAEGKRKPNADPLCEGETYADLRERAIQAKRGRRGRIEAFASAWAEDDPEAALTTLVSLNDSDLHAELVDEVLAAWLTAQPVRAGRWLARQTPSMWSYFLAENSLSGLLEKDVSAALAAAKAFPAADFDRLARRGFGKALEHDFDTAVAWLETVEGPSDTGLRHTYAREYGRREPREALDWAMYGEADEARRSQRVGQVFRGIAREDWTRARRLLDVVDDPESRLEAALVVVGSASADEWNVACRADVLGSEPRIRRVGAVRLVGRHRGHRRRFRAQPGNVPIRCIG